MPIVTQYIKGIRAEAKKKEKTDWTAWKKRTFDFLAGSHGKVGHLVAKEDVACRKGEAQTVEIEPVSIPESSLISVVPYAIHKAGIVVGIVDKTPRPTEFMRTADSAVFFPYTDGIVKKGDVLGRAVYFPMEELRE
ncbi:MAG: DUF22 domain-containing protein [Methanotrichaceae archaeon]